MIGAPEVIKALLKPESCPENYDKISMHHMTMGQRVLAMAYRKLTKKEMNASLKDAKRETVESDLIFAGFLVLDCPVKGDSKVCRNMFWGCARPLEVTNAL
jgi:cation-transporting ATPase 13A1